MKKSNKNSTVVGMLIGICILVKTINCQYYRSSGTSGIVTNPNQPQSQRYVSPVQAPYINSSPSPPSLSGYPFGSTVPEQQQYSTNSQAYRPEIYDEKRKIQQQYQYQQQGQPTQQQFQFQSQSSQPTQQRQQIQQQQTIPIQQVPITVQQQTIQEVPIQRQPIQIQQKPVYQQPLQNQQQFVTTSPYGNQFSASPSVTRYTPSNQQYQGDQPYTSPSNQGYNTQPLQQQQYPTDYPPQPTQIPEQPRKPVHTPTIIHSPVSNHPSSSPVSNHPSSPPYTITNSHQHGVNVIPLSPDTGNRNTFDFNAGNLYTPKNPEDERQILNRVVPGAERFALDFFELASRTSEQNYMLSPFSVWLLLVLLSEGASGQTYQQIENRLQLPQREVLRAGYQIVDKILRQNTDSAKLIAFNALVTDMNRPALQDYERTIEEIYKADLFPVDFKDAQTAYNQINNYTSLLTNGNLQNLVGYPDILKAQMILLSGIHFEGLWKFPFNETFTRREPFYDIDGREIGQVNMMFERANFPYAAVSELEAHVLELPYGHNNQLSMIIMLPRKGATVSYVISKLKNFGVQRVLGELSKNLEDDDEVEVYLPRFTIETQQSLVDILKSMGITDLFTSEANFDKIVANKSMYVSNLIQKTKIIVNEKGTIASAASAAVLANKSTPPRFYANRPFAYLIVDKATNLALVCGSFGNPNQNLS